MSLDLLHAIGQLFGHASVDTTKMGTDTGVASKQQALDTIDAKKAKDAAQAGNDATRAMEDQGESYMGPPQLKASDGNGNPISALAGLVKTVAGLFG